MIKYESFSLENYKGIKEKLTFSLSKNNDIPHCIIGNNESGKTTILKGIQLIDILCKGMTIDNGRRKAIKPKGDYFSGTVKLGAKLSCSSDLLKSNEKLSKYFKDKSGTKISFEFTYKFEDSLFVSGSDKKNIRLNNQPVEDADRAEIFKIMGKDGPKVFYYDDFKFVVPRAIRFWGSSKDASVNKLYYEATGNMHWQEIFDDILRGSNEKANNFQVDVVDWYDDANNKDVSIAENRLRNMGKYLDEILREWIDAQHYNIEGFEITKKPPETEEDKEFHDFRISIKAGMNSYDMDERSKGLQWSFCFHMLTKIRQNREDTAFIFLLDEPANNLHISPQNKMLTHLNNLCNKESAVIYSTHAPELIGVENECYENTFIAKNNNENELKDTNIKLYKLLESGDFLDIQDIEPMLAKLSYADFKKITDADKTNSLKKWGKSIASVLNDEKRVGQAANYTNIATFLERAFGAVFGN